MDYAQFEELVKNRQSCRKFSDKKIDSEDLKRILNLAVLSPSACNSQPWRFAVAVNETAKEVAHLTQGLGMNRFTSDCPAFIIAIEEKVKLYERIADKIKDQDFKSIDLGIAAAHIVLAAKSLGIDSCILGWFNEEKLKTLLKEKNRIRFVVALGYAAENYPTREKDRKPYSETVRFIE